MEEHQRSRYNYLFAVPSRTLLCCSGSSVSLQLVCIHGEREVCVCVFNVGVSKSCMPERNRQTATGQWMRKCSEYGVMVEK